MISLETIERTIDELESREESFRLCERLAWLYIVRDHLMDKYKTKTRKTRLRGSEFFELVNDVDYNELMGVLDEHMQTLYVVNPKLYESTMQKIRELPERSTT